MYLISQITDDPLQTTTLILPNGDPMQMTLYFRPMQFGWFINNLTYQTFVLNGLRITVSPNMLYQFQNQIPFGLACLSNSQPREPTQQEDFVSGAFSLYLLSATEVEELTEFLQNGG